MAMDRKQRSLKIVFNCITVIGILVTIILCIYGIRLGVFKSPGMLSEFIARAGYLGPVVFIGIQIIQVVIPIIPGGVSIVAGVAIFGPVYGFIYNYIGIVIGSIINFLLARRLGKPFVESVVSKRTYDRYIGWLDTGSRFDKLFAFAIFFPVSPDDYLCLLAGLTKMTLKKFVAIILICKPFTILVFSYGLSIVMNWLASIFA